MAISTVNSIDTIIMKQTIILGYTRASTNKQENDNQKFEILEYARTNNLHITDWIEIVASTRKSEKERKLEQVTERLAKKGILVVTEVSRLGRSTAEVLTFINSLLKLGHRVIITKKHLDLQGNNDFTSKILLTVFSMMAELERDLISLRTKEALAAKKAQGQILGKPRGTIQRSMYDKDKELIVDYLNKELSLNSVIKLLGYGKSRSLFNYVKSRKLRKTN